MEHLHKSKMDDKTKGSISRLIQIWQERQIFDPKTQSELTKIWNSHLKRPKVEDNKSDEPGTPPGTPPLPKIKRELSKSHESSKKNGNISSSSLEEKPEFKRL